MSVQQEIEVKLQAGLDPVHLDVVNESSNHNVPPGSETHFKVLLVSSSFEGKPLVTRHRMVNQLLAHELANGVHALSLKLVTPDQWEGSGHQIKAETPACMHKK